MGLYVPYLYGCLSKNKFLCYTCCMTTKQPIYIMLLLLTSISSKQVVGQSKEKNYTRTNPMLGIVLSETKFNRFQSIKNIETGFHIHFLNGINTKYDYIVSIGCLPTEKAYDGKDTSSNKTLLLESSVLLQRRLFPFYRKVNIGVGVGAHSFYLYQRLYPGVSFGSEVDLRLNASTKLQTSASYLLNHTIYSGWRLQLGLYGTLKKKKLTTSSPLFVTLPVRSDRDGDGVADEADHCPDQSGLPVFDGCPDTDLDDIPDEKDSCVSVPGIAQSNGCPVVQQKKAAPQFVASLSADSVTAELNHVAKNIQFPNNEYVIPTAATSYVMQIAYILGRLQFDSLYITGHTDAIGNSEDNLLLSERRAEAVKNALIAMGVPAAKIIALGKGETEPVADNYTSAGRQLNRRTEFRLKL